MRLSELYTRDAANEGKEFNLPDMKGRPTGEKIRLRHSLSDMGIAGRSIMQSRVPDTLGDVKDEVERAVVQRKLVAEALSYLVVDWTLEDECTRENAQALFENAPHLVEWVDQVTSEADSFFGTASTD